MNNPQETTTKEAEEANNANAISNESKYKASIFAIKLPINNQTIDFTKLYGDTILLTTTEDWAHFLSEVNASAQAMLPTKERTTILSWMEQQNDIDFTKDNLLFYPVTMQQDCNLTISNDDNHTLSIKRNNCREGETYYPLFLTINKALPSITLELWGKRIVIQNR